MVDNVVKGRPFKVTMHDLMYTGPFVWTVDAGIGSFLNWNPGGTTPCSRSISEASSSSFLREL